MPTPFRTVLLAAVAWAAPVFLTPSVATAQFNPSSFTYQGELQSGGVPYTGPADVRFQLFPDSAGMIPIGIGPYEATVDCVDGRFTTLVDFLVDVPQGAYLEISIRAPHDPSDSLPYTTLSPRHPMTPAPIAKHAINADSATSAGSAVNAQTATNATTASNALTLEGFGASYFLNASNLNFGVVPSLRLQGTYSSQLAFTNNLNTFTGNGSGLTALSAANISTGTLSPARGGTGTSFLSATPGHVLKWNGSAFATSPDSDTTYSAGAGLTLTGTTFSVPTGGITGGMIFDGTIGTADIGAAQVTNTHLASDAASLLKVSGGAMQTNGTNIGIGSVAPASTLHLQTAAPILAVQSNSNGGNAQLDLTETVTSQGIGGRLLYDGTNNLFQIGTFSVAAGPFVPAMTMSRGINDVTFAGDIIIPTTTRSLFLPPAAFVPSSSGNAYFLDAVGLQNTSGSGVQVSFYAPVSLPDGAVITGFSFRCLDNDGTVDMTVELHAVSISTGADTPIGPTTTSGGSASLRTFNSPVLAQAVNNQLTSYTMRATWAGPLPNATFIKLLGVRIDYTITSPLP